MEYKIDAKNKKLGRLASEVAVILQGKKTPAYNPRLVGKDKVTVENISKIDIGERRAKTKVYYRHTGYIGHLKKRTLKELMVKAPEKALWGAVYNMLPKNRLRKQRMKKLIIQ